MLGIMKPQNNQKEILVIRPSGVWNSRSPLNDYIQDQKALSKSVSLTSLALYHLRADIEAEDNFERSGRQFLKRITKKKANAANHWINYRRSSGTDQQGKAIQPILKTLYTDSHASLLQVQEMAVVRLAALFEAFAQSWALNMLLAKLDIGKVLSKKEEQIAIEFFPFDTKGRIREYIPTLPRILTAFPSLQKQLSHLPHVFTHPETGKKIDKPMSKTLNALTALTFWRRYRNLSIHSTGLISHKFIKKNGAFFEEAMSSSPQVGSLEPGKRMPFHDDIYGAMAATHYRAALFMNEQLLLASEERRGHPEAPDVITTTHWEIPPRSPMLVLPSDHAQSFTWATSAEFRREIAAKHGWKL